MSELDPTFPPPAPPEPAPDPESISAATPEDTAKIDINALLPAQPIAPPPRPKPIIIPERTADGYRTPSLELRRAGAAGFYLKVDGHEQRTTIHVTESQLEQLYGLLDGAPGALWRKLSDIPLERPRPSRALEEELRVLMTTFAGELRRRR